MKNTLQEAQENEAPQALQLTSAEDYYYQNIRPLYLDRINKLNKPEICEKELMQIARNVLNQKSLSKHQKILHSRIEKRIKNWETAKEDQPQTIAQIINDYNNNLTLLDPVKQYSTALALTGVRAYHLHALSKEQQNVFFAPSILNYLNNNSKIKASYKNDRLQNKEIYPREKYPFALGNPFGKICDYLSNKEIMLLLSTNKFLRNNVKIYKNQMSSEECQNIVNKAIENRKEFLDLFRKSHLAEAVKLLNSTEIVAYNDINAHKPNLLKMITNPAEYRKVHLHVYNLEQLITIFQLILQKGGMQDIYRDGTNLLKALSYENLLKIINAKPVKLIKVYKANPTKLNLNASDPLGETILLEALSNLHQIYIDHKAIFRHINPPQGRILNCFKLNPILWGEAMRQPGNTTQVYLNLVGADTVRSLIEAGADLNKSNSIIDEKPLERLIRSMEINMKFRLKEQEELLQYIITKLKSDPDALKMSLNKTKSSILHLSHKLSLNTFNMFLDAGLDVSLTDIIKRLPTHLNFQEHVYEGLINCIITKLKSEPSALKTNLEEVFPELMMRISYYSMNHISDNILKIFLDAGLSEVSLENHVNPYNTLMNRTLYTIMYRTDRPSWITMPKSAKFFIDKMPLESNSSECANSVIKLFNQLISFNLRCNPQEGEWVDYFIERLQSKPEVVTLFIKENLGNINKYFSNLGNKASKFLIDMGLDLNQVLILAIEDSNAQKIKLIIESGADVNKADENGVAPLLALLNRACLNYANKKDGRLESTRMSPDKIIKLKDIKKIIELLIQHGADVNKAAQDMNSISPLEGAMKMTAKNTLFSFSEIKEIIELLINKGATRTENVKNAAKASRLTKFIDECYKAVAPTTAPKKRDEKANDKEHKLFDKVEKIIYTEPKTKKELALASEYNANRDADDVVIQNPAPKNHIMQAAAKKELNLEEAQEFSVSDFIDRNPEALKDFSGEDANFNDLY